MADFEPRMRTAIALAAEAASAGEVPIGCIVVDDLTDKIIAQSFNRRETDHDPTAHAEILALRQAARHRGHWRLTDCTILVTLEPCPMCAGAIVNSRIPRLVYGCDDPKAGAVRTLFQLCDNPKLNHRAQVTSGILSEDCAALLQNFFKAQRALGKK